MRLGDVRSVVRCQLDVAACSGPRFGCLVAIEQRWEHLLECPQWSASIYLGLQSVFAGASSNPDLEGDVLFVSVVTTVRLSKSSARSSVLLLSTEWTLQLHPQSPVPASGPLSLVLLRGLFVAAAAHRLPVARVPTVVAFVFVGGAIGTGGEGMAASAVATLLELQLLWHQCSLSPS